MATIMVAGLLLIVVTRPIGTEGTPAAVGTGSSFYVVGERGTGLGIGDRPPSLTNADEEPISDLDGDAVDITQLSGHPVWVIFWATWCPPCQQETPDIQRAWEAYIDTGLKVIAIDVQESTDIAGDYAAKYGLTYDIAIDRTGSAFKNWSVFGLPTHYFIGADGRIKDRFFGPLTLEQMRDRLDVITGS